MVAFEAYLDQVNSASGGGTTLANKNLVERRLQLHSGRDTELREHAVEVGTDRPLGKVEPLADPAVTQTLGRQLSDLKLLGVSRVQA